MASKTVAQFLGDLVTEIKNPGNTNVNKALRLALVRALSRLTSYKTLFTENTFSFNATAGKDEYGTLTTGFPVDPASFDVLEFSTAGGPPGSAWVPIVQVPIELLLRERRGGAYSSNGCSPYYFAWHKQLLELAPPPPINAPIRGWYHRDARRDQGSGTLIDATAASDGMTNDWFGDGEDALWQKTMMIYHAAFAVDAERATYYNAEFQEAIGNLTKQFERKTMPGWQMDWGGL